MHHQFKLRVQETQTDVIAEPKHKQPARPVAPAEHEHARKNRQQPDEAHPKKLIFNRTTEPKLVAVVRESDDAGGYEYPTDDRNRDRTFSHPTYPAERCCRQNGANPSKRI